MAGRNPLKDKLEDEELDLSMMQLTDVPVRVGLEDEEANLLIKPYLNQWLIFLFHNQSKSVFQVLDQIGQYCTELCHLLLSHRIS